MTHASSHTHTHTPTSVRGNVFSVDVRCQCTASPIALTTLPSQSNVKTGMQAPHFTADRKKKRGKKNTVETFKVFSGLIGHSKTFKTVIQSPVFAYNTRAFFVFLVMDLLVTLFDI